MAQQTLLQNDAEFSWDFKGSNTRYATHGMHTYLAAMVPPLARKLIHDLVPESGRLLDPFCGGGAVVVEGVLNNIPSTGLDINPLAILLTKAKTHKIDEMILLDEFNNILENGPNYKGDALDFPTRYKIDYWFKPYMFKPLTGLITQIDKIEDEHIKTFFQVVFSATVRDVSLTYRNEQRLRRLIPKDFEKFNPDVFFTFRKRAINSIERLRSLPENATSDVRFGSNLAMPFDDNEFTNIICSPPYGDERNGVPYSQFSKNMLIWLGYTREELLYLKKLSLGGISQNKVCFKSDYLESELEHFSKKQSIIEAISFYNDYFKSLREMIRVTSKYITIVVGNRTLNGRVIDNGRITIELMNSLGTELHSKYQRTLPHKRLPKMGTHNGAQITKEDILTFSAGL